MFCRETVSDSRHKIEVSVCLTDGTRDLIVHVKNLDRRTKQVAFADCMVDLASIGGDRHRSGLIRLTVSQSRPNNWHVIASQLPSRIATNFRNLNTDRILCVYDVRVLEEQAEATPFSGGLRTAR
jgi:hypothetical protein